MDEAQLRAIYVSAAGALDEIHAAAILAAAGRVLARALAAHPDFGVSPSDFVNHVALLAGVDQSAAEALDEMEAGDVYLAFACARRDPAAMAKFEQLLISVAGPKIEQKLRNRSHVDEVLQRVRVRCMLGSSPGAPKLFLYAGEAPLKAWLRMVAVRQAYSFLQETWVRVEELGKEPPEPIVDLPPPLGPDSPLDADRFKDHLQEALRAAVRSIARRDRAILHLSSVAGLSIDSIGEHYGVDRSTAARWIQKAKMALSKAVRVEFCRRAGISDSEYSTMQRTVRAHVDLSIESALRDEDGDQEPEQPE
jgi:RNA polymerase sigma-70 factor (ECF subfamily)